jgi:hypothetical protein
MISDRYKLHTPTLAIRSLPEGKRVPVTIPKNSLLTVTFGPIDGTRLVDVEWEGEMVMMFTVDLRKRSSKIGLI